MHPDPRAWHADPELAPAVHALLVTAGYRLVLPARGSRHGSVQRWLLLADDGTAAQADVLGGDDLLDRNELDALVSRARIFQAFRHPHLLPVREVLETPGPRPLLVVISDRVPGTDLLALCRSRGPLSPGEGVTLGVPVLQALAALHARGIVHGDVSASNVVIDRQGRPVLVDVLCGALGNEGGTPGTRSPERVAGGPADAAGDVYAAAALVLGLLAPRSERDGQSPFARVEHVLAPALEDEPDRRPDAAVLAAALLAAVEAEPIGGLDLAERDEGAGPSLAAVEAPGSLRAPTNAGDDGGRHRHRTTDVLAGLPTVHRRTRRRPRPGGHERRASFRRRPELARRRRDEEEGGSGNRSHRRRGRWQRWSTALTLAAVLGVGAWVLTAQLGGSEHVAVLPGALSDPDDPVGAAVALTELRAEVLGSGTSPVRLGDVVALGSPAHQADRDLLDRLRARGMRLEDLNATVLEAGTMSDPGPGPHGRHGPDGPNGLSTPGTLGTSGTLGAPGSPGHRVTVRVRTVTSSHRVVDEDGTVLREVPERDASVGLVLVWGVQGWRVSDVLADG